MLPKLVSIFEGLLGGSVSDDRLVDLSRNLARGLTFLHYKIAHLDVNPSNLCVTDNHRLF